MQRSLLPLLQRMPRLRGSIGILLALTGPVSVPGAVGFGDEIRSSSFSEGMLSSRPKATSEWSTAFEQPSFHLICRSRKRQSLLNYFTGEDHEL